MDLLDVYERVRRDSVAMCQPLQTEDYIPQPAFFVSPPKWFLGHTSWFFEAMVLKAFMKGYREFHETYGYLFNSYYLSAGERVARHQRGDLSRPTVEEVYRYRDHVDKFMLELMNSPACSPQVRELILLGLNHEQQHQELFYTDLKYTFSVNPLFPAYGDRALCEDGPAGKGEFLRISEGLYDIGHRGAGFCYDNELAAHRVFLQEFEIAADLVSNGQFMEFIADGGYEKFHYWHDEGWTWLQENQWKKPLYWHKRDGDWYQFTLAGLRPIEPDHILTHVNYYEASAFAQWKGCRLPSEFEWEAACDRFEWGRRWEWTGSAYLPYPGYRAPQGAIGEYNGKFMVNQMVLRGASLVTPAGHSRKTYRNFFHPWLGWQFNGIRLARS